MCVSWECNNFITGTTCNPYDTNRNSGGSSGGEVCTKHFLFLYNTERVKDQFRHCNEIQGALLGSGASIVGLGSDVAGSVRIPAMFNGVFGHKSTPGVLI